MSIISCFTLSDIKRANRYIHVFVPMEQGEVNLCHHALLLSHSNERTDVTFIEFIDPLTLSEVEEMVRSHHGMDYILAIDSLDISRDENFDALVSKISITDAYQNATDLKRRHIQEFFLHPLKLEVSKHDVENRQFEDPIGTNINDTGYGKTACSI